MKQIIQLYKAKALSLIPRIHEFDCLTRHHAPTSYTRWQQFFSDIQYACLIWFRLVCSVLVNNDTLTANYGVKQSHFTKPTSEPRASDPEESNETFDRAFRG